MSLAIVHSRAQIGVEAPVVTVEVHLANGLPALTLVLVGLLPVIGLIRRSARQIG